MRDHRAKKTVEQYRKLEDLLREGASAKDALIEAGWSHTQAEKGWKKVPKQIRRSIDLTSPYQTWIKNKGLRQIQTLGCDFAKLEEDLNEVVSLTEEAIVQMRLIARNLEESSCLKRAKEQLLDVRLFLRNLDHLKSQKKESEAVKI